MRKIPPPTIDAWILFKSCLDSFKSNTLPSREKLLTFETEIRNNHKNYENSAKNCKLNSFIQCETLISFNNENSKNDFLKLYKDGLAKKSKESIYRFYEQIRLGEQKDTQQFCAYCGIGYVKEVDHFLPKNSFYTLSVEPLNLLPACNTCNDCKESYSPNLKPESVLFHPYFDDINNNIWLSATIFTKGEKLICDFFINNSFPDQILLDRIKLTIQKLKIIDFTYNNFKIKILDYLRITFEDEKYQTSTGIDDLKIFVTSELKKFNKIHYQNHPKVVIYEAALDYINKFSSISELLSDD